MAEGYWVVCPLCGLSRKLYKTGAYAKRYGISLSIEKTVKKSELRFDRLDPEKAVFIDVRETGLGRGAGFPRVEHLCLTLKEVKDNKEFENLIKQIQKQIKLINDILANNEK